MVSFHDPVVHLDIQFRTVQCYDALNIPLTLRIPPNTLPRDISAMLSKEQLEKQLSLVPLKLNALIKLYFDARTVHLLQDRYISTCLLSFISTHLSQLSPEEWNEVKTTLSQTVCISTTKGMQIPSKSFIPSELLSSELPIVQLNIIADQQSSENVENPVSTYFLKQIGCRTVNIDAVGRDQAVSNNSGILQTFIQDLVKQRNNLSEADFKELKTKASLIGTTLAGTEKTKRKYIPRELHFPSVAIVLEWTTLPSIDWPDIDPRSPEYSFLKEIGVQEVPNLEKLLERIIQEHHEEIQKQNTNGKYNIPRAFRFFVENFSEHYNKSWKTGSLGQYKFLPSHPPEKTSNEINANDVILLATNEIFTVVNPLFPSPLTDVIELFQKHVDIALLGIKDNPSLPQAFNTMMKKATELLTEQTASKIFAYMNELDGLNNTFIANVSQFNFIPLQGHSNDTILMKPSQVFIRSDVTSSKTTTTETNGIDTRGLIDYVDFGVAANTFLSRVGVRNDPTPSALAELLIDRQVAYFKSAENDKDLLNSRINVYIDCLKKLAVAAVCSNELQQNLVSKRLRTNAWCLGFQTIVDKNGVSEQHFKIVNPNKIYLDDNSVYSKYFQPLLPPLQQGFPKLYEQFGAQWLSGCIQEKKKHKGTPVTSQRATQLQKLIENRFPILFVDNKPQSTTSCILEHDKSKVTLYLRQDVVSLDYHHITRELVQFAFNKSVEYPCEIRDKLELPLEMLEQRGIPVARLLSTAPTIGRKTK
ncbi:unnamed protein product [Rotaria sp. Silwood2]|nr:unnamed protein product [Rotaria sp. Silwood2]CAF3037497.1 unnamed protein product [Rotaria sp. Silwood2]CAF3360026.1 unnamed protein product [Rotaria sp. Silwood2]